MHTVATDLSLYRLEDVKKEGVKKKKKITDLRIAAFLHEERGSERQNLHLSHFYMPL